MRADQKIIVGGTRRGERVVSEPLPAVDAIARYREMLASGYTQLTMTDAETGEDYRVDQRIASGAEGKQ